MSEIEIGEVKVKNFLGISSASVDFSNRGLVLLEGENGVGKTSITVEPLLYALFGISERYGVRRDKIVNRFVGSDCHVHLPLSIDNEVNIVIDSYRKHRKFKDPIHNITVGGDEVFLFINGEDKRGNTNDQTWGKIEKLIDMDYTAFTSAVVFGQAISQYFSGLSDSSQKDIVERLLGITWISQAYELSKRDNEDCRNKIIALSTEISTYSKSIEEKVEDIEKYKTKFVEFESEREQKIENLKQGFGKISDISDLEEKAKDSKEKLSMWEDEYSELDAKVKDQEKEIAVCNSEIKLKNTEISKCLYNLEDLLTLKEGTFCDKCGGIVGSESVSKYRSNLELGKQDLEGGLSNLKLKLVKFNSERSKVISKKLEVLSKVTELQNSLESLDKILQGLIIKNVRIEENNSAIIKQIKEIKSSKCIYQELIDKLSEEVAEISILKSKAISDLGILQGEAPYNEFWEEGYSNRGLKSYMIESVTPKMNEYAKIYSFEMGGKYEISFLSQKQLKKGEFREKFHVDVLNKFGADDYDGNSNGERRAIDAIVMFVLGDLASSRNSNKFSLLILDDVFEKLSERVCDSIIRVLRKMVSKDAGGLPSRKSIFVLSHLESFRGKFENRMIMEEKNGQKILQEI